MNKFIKAFVDTLDSHNQAKKELIEEMKRLGVDRIDIDDNSYIKRWDRVVIESVRHVVIKDKRKEV